MAFVDTLGHELYKNVIGKKDTHIQTFTLLDAWAFAIRCAQENSLAEGFGILVEKKGDHYDINQFMLRKENGEYKGISAGGNFLVGRTIEAYNLDGAFLEFMDGKSTKVVDMDRLKK